MTRIFGFRNTEKVQRQQILLDGDMSQRLKFDQSRASNRRGNK